MIQRFEHFSYDISEIYHYWHKIAADEMKKYGLKGPYAIYFTALYHAEHGLTAAQLSEQCGRDKADVSRAVSQMEAGGFLTKSRLRDTTYRARLSLTEKGRETAEKINLRASEAVELGGAGLTEEQRTIFYHALDLIASNLHKLSEK